MITKYHDDGPTRSSATYSPCETYRYALTRVWDTHMPRVTFVMLNPSKATQAHNDPTIARLQRRSTLLGFGSFCAVNLFALRETDPALMRKHPQPMGPDNDAEITKAAAWADTVIAAWGVHGTLHNRHADVQTLLAAQPTPLHVLGLTKDGHPRHPLYMPYAAQPVLWTLAR